MNFEDEDIAVERLKEMIADYSDDLKTLWRWGDGDGGYILEEIRKGIGINSQEPTETSYKKKKMPGQLRIAVFERDKYRCVYCGDYHDLCADHIIPESKGGETSIENLQTLCRFCNTSKGVS
jgi:predicted restriction endonuclease